ncbi:hypothetical protein [Pseudomonas baetica]|uniref:hypothetical protein n=1 Tax=Pseudomonas baetica TaxID=674054 RepID=UPI0024063E45|nr:hypothetical protein [Pseudomonas baetica]MDF9779046.1 hypothetical protein [Pseudomonas baetica]
MTTTASIQITSQTTSVLFYQECDGYPSFALNHLGVWLGTPANTSGDLNTGFLQTYGAAVGHLGAAVQVDNDPLDTGEDADWVYLIDLSSRTVTVQHREYTGDQSPVHPLKELDVILDAYKAEVHCSICRAIHNIEAAGFTLTPATTNAQHPPSQLVNQ